MRHLWLLDELREASLPYLLNRGSRPSDALLLQQGPEGLGEGPEGLDGDVGVGIDLRQMAQLGYSFGKVRWCI